MRFYSPTLLLVIVSLGLSEAFAPVLQRRGITKNGSSATSKMRIPPSSSSYFAAPNADQESGRGTDTKSFPKDFVATLDSKKEELDTFLVDEEKEAASLFNDSDLLLDEERDGKEPTLQQLEEEGEIEYSIDNEISLKQFIQIINKNDRGISAVDDDHDNFLRIANLLLSKTIDTAEDAILMLKRGAKRDESSIPVSADVLNEWNDPDLKHKPRLLVIGSGWASHAFIKVIDTEMYRVLNVSPTNYFVFTPMLASSSVGTTEVRSIVESVRDSNPTVRFLEGTGVHVDVQKKQLNVKLGQGTVLKEEEDGDEGYNGHGNTSNAKQAPQIVTLDYDILVHAAGVGPISSSNRVPGLNMKNVHFLKSVNDAKRLRSSVIDLLEGASQPTIIDDEERKRLLTFVIVGAGPTGVEYTGELKDFLADVTGVVKNNKESNQNHRNKRSGIKRTVAPFANLLPYTRVILISGSKELLPQFDQELRISAKQQLEETGVEVLTSTRVTRIESNNRLIVSVQNDNGEKSEEAIDCGIIVWAGGTQPVKLTGQLMNNMDEYCAEQGGDTMVSSFSTQGRIPVDKWMRVIGNPSGNVLAMGDAAVTVGDGTTILPQTAQVAAQQGAYVARLLNRRYNLSPSEDGSNGEHSLFLEAPYNYDAIDGDFVSKLRLRGAVKAKPFEFLNLGQLAYIGGGEALSQVQLGDNRIFNQAGSIGFLLWRSVYVVKQVSTKTRLLVLFDWFKTKIFGRDVTRM